MHKVIIAFLLFFVSLSLAGCGQRRCYVDEIDEKGMATSTSFDVSENMSCRELAEKICGPAGIHAQLSLSYFVCGKLGVSP